MSQDRLAYGFSIFMRLVFLFAFGAFLRASIQHIADFFQTFEGADETTGYTLAIAIDGTSLVLTAGLMFFRKNMSPGVFFGIWIFIIFLTAFSWVINWQYAVSHQDENFIGHLDPFWKTANPIFASSFAVLNIAYTIVAEAFSRKEKSEQDLQAELDNLTGEKAKLKAKIAEAKKNEKSAIQVLKEKAMEAASAGKEVAELLSKKTPEIPALSDPNSETKNESDSEDENESEDEDFFESESEDPSETDLKVETLESEEVTFGFIDTGEHEKVEEIVSKKRNRNTDQLSNKSSVSRNLTAKKSSTKEQKILQLLSKNPKLKPAEIAEKVAVTPQYASQIKNKVLGNQPTKMNVNTEEIAG